MSNEHKAYASTAAATLEAHILSVHSAKSEAEWWAQREIGRLRAENETHKEIAIRATMKVATLRAALKPFADILEKHGGFEKLPIDVAILYAAATAYKETGDE